MEYYLTHKIISLPTGEDYLQSYYLYVLSDDEIKPGEWGYDEMPDDEGMVREFIFKHREENLMTSTRKKIIASSNPNLNINDYSSYWSCCKSKDECEHNTPMLTDEFVSKFYINPVSEVEVQYEQFMTDGWVPSYNNPDNYNLDEPAELDYRIKISDDNTITIKS